MPAASAQLTPLLDERAVSSILNISVPTLRRWRVLNRGPRYLKLSSAVRYRPEDISGFLNSSLVGDSDQRVA
jgi:predicted DNA-binding transcriptional regulator AlpA